jgi:hypothetical protein
MIKGTRINKRQPRVITCNSKRPALDVKVILSRSIKSKDEMPEVSRFFGIVIRMYFNDHNPPHFHAEYGDYEALIDIDTLS